MQEQSSTCWSCAAIPGFEFKRTDAPRITPSMNSALEALQLTRLDMVHAGRHSFPLAANVRAVAAADLFSEFKPLRG